MKPRFWIGLIPAFAFAFAIVAACGGGGGASSTAPPVSSANEALVSTGTITGFGSVHVNGEHFLTKSTTFAIGDAPGTQADLRVGHRIHVRGHRDGSGNAIADRIEFHAEVRGPVASVDAAAGTLVVLGQTVIVDADTSFDDNIAGSSLAGVSVGANVEVSGTRRADGAILATRIEAKPAGAPLEVRGTVSSLDATAHKFRIAALVVDYSTATLQDFGGGQPRDGDLVEVKGGSVNAAGELVARIVEKKNGDDESSGDRAELEGPITRFVSATDFDVVGRHVTTSASTTFENGTAADLALDVKVEAEGSIDANGVLVARKVSFRRRGDARVAAVVDSVNATAGTLVVLGIDVTVNSLTRVEDKSEQRVNSFTLANIAAGDWVEVRGAELPANSNDVVATRLERRRADRDVRLRGVVDTVTRPAFTILGVTVQTGAGTDFEDESADAFFDGLQGRTVSVKGSVSNGVLVAREVEFEDHDD